MAKVQELPTLNQVGNYTAVSNDMMKKYAGKIGIGPIVAWSLIYNRYQSSQGKDSFWDEEQEDYYAIFTVKELVNFLGVSATTVNDFLNKLVNEDLLLKTKPKKGFNKANRFFPKLPFQFSKVIEHKPGTDEPIPAPKEPKNTDIIDKPKSGVSVIKNTFVNHLTLNYSSSSSCYSFYTKHSAIKQTTIGPQHATKNDTDSEFTKTQDLNDWETAKHKLLEIGIPTETVSVLSAYSHNQADKLNMYRKLLLEAKASVRKQAKGSLIDDKAFSNEENNIVQENILWAVRRAFSYIRKSCKTKEHANNYFRATMKTFYENAVNAYAQGAVSLVG
ncbi:hypothetical protein EFO90_09100 [Lactiplantibacillus plantarum]|uniref:hypothetical protein n=1 Tax=Lactiplantibacillus plantarum TaxID=1590 RepID=UPI0021A2CEDB|nr:hypothetical protein [Lactiplantibacillus plantarum]MCT3214516.1 hypothetical protein [Lactiplantibacillus plantarum]MCT3272093.1 hypothetical protein [Lactiplantibacillus plantarum]